MISRQEHRGPDERGVWSDRDHPLTLGHARLSILDLSPTGSQPMVSDDGNLVLIYNGEIYNYVELREALRREGAHFHGSSDTEVVLQACAHWGIRTAVERFNGMFAFALWSRADRRLYLVRDRLGEKPLFFARTGRTVAFASELRSLRETPYVSEQLSAQGLGLALRFKSVPAPMTVLEDASKLEPASILAVNIRDDRIDVESIRYWKPPSVDRSRTELDEVELDELLRSSVSMRLRSDVPVGVLLSGGIDSTLVAALANELAAPGLQTFTIGFDEQTHDEATHARRIASFLGTDHHEIRLTGRDAIELALTLPQISQEPLADASVIPTHLVASVARQHVKVALTGDGGDELFAGYARYQQLAAQGHLPFGPWAERLGRLLGRTHRRAPALSLRLAGRPLDLGMVGGRLGGQLRSASTLDRYVASIADFPDPGVYLADGLDHSIPHPARERIDLLDCTDVEIASRFDLVSYLPDDVLNKVDSATMASSLEARPPLLDHRVVELASMTPVSAKAGDRPKAALHRALARRVPVELFDRPKAGFGIPLDEWLRGPLRPWMLDHLSADSLRATGAFSAEPVRRLVRAHDAGRLEAGQRLWTICAIQSWLLDRP